MHLPSQSQHQGGPGNRPVQRILGKTVVGLKQFQVDKSNSVAPLSLTPLLFHQGTL